LQKKLLVRFLTGVTRKVQGIDPREMGRVVKAGMPCTVGRVEGKTVSALVHDRIAKINAT